MNAAMWPVRTLWSLLAPLRAWYVRGLIEAAERDLFWHEQDLRNLPLQIEIDRRHLSALQVRLIDLGGA